MENLINIIDEMNQVRKAVDVEEMKKSQKGSKQVRIGTIVGILEEELRLVTRLLEKEPNSEYFVGANTSLLHVLNRIKEKYGL